jgi:ABC-2 type transport system permease protein
VTTGGARVGSTGAVYDRGYRPYDGQLGGRRAVVRALWLASIRRALGLRRAWRQKLMPWTLLAIVTVPAAVQVGVGYLTRDTPASDFTFITYREYVGVSNALLLFVAITAPDIMCPDRRQRVLSLILSRPLTGVDYAFAKFAAIFTIVFGFGFIPHVVLFIGQMLVSDDGSLTYVRDNLDVLWRVPLAVAVLAGYYSAIGVAVASLTTRRVVGAVSFVGLLLVSGGIVSAIVYSRPLEERGALGALNLLAIPTNIRDLIFLGEFTTDGLGSGDGVVAAVIAVFVAVLAACASVLYLRYRSVDG